MELHLHFLYGFYGIITDNFTLIQLFPWAEDGLCDICQNHWFVFVWLGVHTIFQSLFCLYLSGTLLSANTDL